MMACLQGVVCLKRRLTRGRLGGTVDEWQRPPVGRHQLEGLTGWQLLGHFAGQHFLCNRHLRLADLEISRGLGVNQVFTTDTLL